MRLQVSHHNIRKHIFYKHFTSMHFSAWNCVICFFLTLQYRKIMESQAGRKPANKMLKYTAKGKKKKEKKESVENLRIV